MKKKYLSFILTLLSLVVFVGCGSKNDANENKNTDVADLINNLEKAEENQKIEEEAKKLAPKEIEAYKRKEKSEKEKEESPKEKKADIKKVKIKVVGDIMAHLAQIQYAYNRGGGSYDFSKSFEYVSDFIKDSDLAIGNYETTTNPNQPYAGFPRFNSPESFLTAIKDTGFDVVTTANNHSMDTELEGVFSTMDAVEDAGLSYVGSMRDESEKILTKKINGIRIAILAYTYGCNGRENLIVPREEVENLNYLTDETQVKEDIKKAKAQGADFVIVYPHWGVEYHSYPVDTQINLGRKMIEWGADLVIGNHPHVVEPVELYKAEDGREGLIAYALGNFISFQSLENNKDIRVEQALALEIELQKDLNSGDKKISDVSFHPLWVGTTYDDFGRNVQTYLAEDFLDGGKYYDYVNENQRARIKQAYDMTLETANTGVE